MPFAHFNNVRIAGIHSTVGSIVRHLDEDRDLFAGSPGQMDRIRKAIGLDRRCVVDESTTTLDLCRQSAQRLLERLDYDSKSIDALIFITQTPDHLQPCNACILHGHLGMPVSTAAFDLNLGCSGYVYGLYVAHSLVSSGGCKRILLLAGDTMSRCVNSRDRSTAILFGDAGSATVIEQSFDHCPSWFSLHSNGSQCDAIKIPAGGFRLCRSDATAEVKSDADGNVRSLDDLHMNGAEVFNFSIGVEPDSIREILEFSDHQIDQIDSVVFHQANKYIINNIARRLKLPLEKAPSGTVGKYGNQSSASIPVTICDALPKLGTKSNLILSGFGVGLSWATGLVQMKDCMICRIETFRRN